MEASAKLINSSHPPRKMRLLADLVRGLPVDQAIGILKYHPKTVYARELEKLILSGVSNWRNANSDADVEESDLFLKVIKVDEGRKLKRIQPAPQGRAHRIIKRSNHVSIVIASNADAASQVDAVAETQEEE